MLLCVDPEAKFDWLALLSISCTSTLLEGAMRTNLGCVDTFPIAEELLPWAVLLLLLAMTGGGTPRYGVAAGAYSGTPSSDPAPSL